MARTRTRTSGAAALSIAAVATLMSVQPVSAASTDADGSGSLSMSSACATALYVLKADLAQLIFLKYGTNTFSKVGGIDFGFYKIVFEAAIQACSSPAPR